MAMEKNFDAASKEAKIWKKWEDANAFKAGVNALPNADSYAIMIPPLMLLVFCTWGMLLIIRFKTF